MSDAYYILKQYVELYYAVVGFIWSMAFMISCVGISYLRTSNHHRYDSSDFIDEDEDEDDDEEEKK